MIMDGDEEKLVELECCWKLHHQLQMYKHTAIITRSRWQSMIYKNSTILYFLLAKTCSPTLSVSVSVSLSVHLTCHTHSRNCVKMGEDSRESPAK